MRGLTTVKSFQNLSLKKKIIGGFSLVIMIFGIVATIYQYTGSKIIAGYNFAIDVPIKAAFRVNHIDISMLECRRSEKDFLLDKDLNNRDKVNENIAIMISEVEEIRNLAQAAGREEVVALLEKIKTTIQIYHNSFSLIVQAWIDRGLNHHSGLQGQFRKNAHQLSDIIKAANDMETDILLLTLRRHEKDYLLRHDTKYIDKALKVIAALTERPLVDPIKLNDYRTGFLALVAKDNEITKLKVDLQSAADELESMLVTLLNAALNDAKLFAQATTASSRQMSFLALTVAVVAGMIGILSSLWISFSITKPVIQAVTFAKALSDGDLTQKLDVDQKDEIGELAASLNQMGASLRQMFTRIADGTNTLTSSATELSAISQQMSAGADQTSGKSNQVSAAAEEMSTSMNSVAAASEQASTNVQMVAAASEQMSATINEIAGNTERGRSITGEAVSQAKNVSTRVAELGKAAIDVGKVTETINEISEQTNLLALNATIEAARAGEAGKGFAVVANEIKELAKQTADATQDIRLKIEGIQNTTEGTVTEINQIETVIIQINEIVATIASAVEEQSTSTKEIASNVNQAAQGIHDVNTNVAQSSTVSADIARDVVEVNQAASDMADGSAQVSTSADELSNLSENLKRMVDKFRL